MLVFIAVAVLFFVLGLLFFLAPAVIVKLSEMGNRLVFTDHGSVAHRWISGSILLAMSAVMLYLGLKL